MPLGKICFARADSRAEVGVRRRYASRIGEAVGLIRFSVREIDRLPPLAARLRPRRGNSTTLTTSRCSRHGPELYLAGGRRAVHRGYWRVSPILAKPPRSALASDSAERAALKFAPHVRGRRGRPVAAGPARPRTAAQSPRPAPLGRREGQSVRRLAERSRACRRRRSPRSESPAAAASSSTRPSGSCRAG